MEPAGKDLEDRLKDVGMRLASPPPGVDELLRLLDETEIYLSRVEQSPSTSMFDALRPAMNSLVTKEYLHHSEADVKAFVAACINEITRITAPDAPYDDSLMKEIFGVIVDAFGKLDDISGTSYSKKVSILETVAKVRSCVVMLDLECDDLILLMFQHFLKCIRAGHSDNVFSSMETIMTLVLEDSEDISQELLDCLLSSVHKSKKDVIPVACRLAEKVISNCAMKLKSYLLVAVKSSGNTLSDYGDIIASICYDCSVAPEQNEESKLFGGIVPDELPQASEKLDKPALEESGTFTDKTRKMLSNGVVPFENGNPIAETHSPEFKHENYFSSDQCSNAIALKGENNKLASVTEKPSNELDLKYLEAKSSSVHLTDASDSSRVDGDKEASSPTIRRAGRKRKTKSSMKSDGASDMVPVTEVLLEPKKASELQPSEGLVGDNARVIPMLPNSGLSEVDQATRLQFSAKRSSTHRPTPSASKKKNSRNTRLEGGMEDNCADDHLDEKLLEESAKKSLDDNAATVDVATALMSDEKSLMKEQNESVKKVAESSSSQKRLKSRIKQPKSKDTTEGNESAEQSKKIIVPSKASREVKDDEHYLGKSVETSSRKKRRRKTSGWKIDTGRRIEVWWPDDQMFYKGVISEFDPVTEKHKVLYDDGDVESLNLSNEHWNYIDSKDIERGHEIDIAGSEPSVQVIPRGSSGKSKASSERDKSPGELNDLPIQQSHGKKSAVKSRGRLKPETSKIGTPVEKTPGNYGSDGTKVEQSHDGKTVVKSRGRPKLQSSNIGTSSPSEKTPVTYGGDGTGVEKSNAGSFKSRRRHKEEASKVGTSPDEKTQGTFTSDATKIEQSHGEKSVAKSRGRYRNEPSEAAPSLNEKTQGTHANDGTKIEESHGGKLAVKSRGRRKRETPKVGTSTNEKTEVTYGSDGPKLLESPQMNISNESPEDNTFNKVKLDGKFNGSNEPGVDKIVVRSRRKPRGEKDLETASNLSPSKVSANDIPEGTSVVKDGALPAVKSGRGSNRFGRRGRKWKKSALKSSGKPTTSSISTQTENLDFPPAVPPGFVITAKQAVTDADGKLEQKWILEPSKDTRKRKEAPATITEGTTDANDSSIKISEGKKVGDDSVARSSDAGTSKRSATKSSKRSRRK